MAQREVILITGANTGIGFQIVRALCSSDKAYDILLGGRSPTKVQEAIKSAMAEFPSSGSKLFQLQVDIEYDDAITHAFGEVQSKFGRVDALINNAGIQNFQLINGSLRKLIKNHGQQARRLTNSSLQDE